MPQIGKQSLAQFIRTGCLRQLALELFPDNRTFRPDREARGMPDPQSPRPGLRQVQVVGDEWAEEKLHDLTRTFGPDAVRGDRRVTPTGHTRYEPVDLGRLIANAVPLRFLIEAEFSMGVIVPGRARHNRARGPVPVALLEPAARHHRRTRTGDFSAICERERGGAGASRRRPAAAVARH